MTAERRSCRQSFQGDECSKAYFRGLSLVRVILCGFREHALQPEAALRRHHENRLVQRHLPGSVVRGPAIDIFSLVRLAKRQGWEGLELDAERPHAAPMDLSIDDRKRLRDLAGELGLELCAVSPNCDLSSPVPVQREAMIGYVRECIKMAHDLGAPICKIFAAWRGITLHDGLATYDDTYSYNQYGFWRGDRRGFVVESMRELCKVADDYGVVLAMQNHGPDIVNRYQDVLSLIKEVGSPVFKACMDINIEPEADSPKHAREMALVSGTLQVHSHVNGEFARSSDGNVYLAAAAISTTTSGDGKLPIRPISIR